MRKMILSSRLWRREANTKERRIPVSRAFTTRYNTVRTQQGFRFVFYCDLCYTKYETEEYRLDSFREAFELAQEEAQYHFNMCHKCGKWICDEHYNQNVMECVECSFMRGRRKTKPGIPTTKTCPHCGAERLEIGDCYCPICGASV